MTLELATEVRKDIKECKEILKSNNLGQAEGKILEIVSTYGSYIDNITSQLDSYTCYFEDRPNYIKDIKTLKRKLEIFLATNCTPTQYYKKASENYIKIANTNTNSNTNNNKLIVDIDFENLKDEIEDMTALPQEQIDEILCKVIELEEVFNSDERPNKKWIRLRGCMEWLGTKGVDVATKLLPVIMKIIQSDS